MASLAAPFDDRFVARENPERIPSYVGYNLAYYRQLKRWTQKKAAKRLGVSVRHLQRLEGGWNMTILTAARLARKYGGSFDSLDGPVAAVRANTGLWKPTR